MDAVRVAVLREILSTSDWINRTRGFARSLRGAAREEGSLLVVGTPVDEPWHFAAHLDDEARQAGIPELAPTLVRHAVPRLAPPHLSIGIDRLEDVRRGEAVVVVAPSLTPPSLLERVDDARRTGATVLAVHAGDRELGSLAHEALAVRPDDLGMLPQAARAVMLPGTSPPPPLRARGDGREQTAGLSRWSMHAFDPVDEDDRGGDPRRPARPETHGNAPGTGEPRQEASAAQPSMDVHALSFEAVQHLVSNAAGEVSAFIGRGRLGFRDRLAQLLDLVSGPPPQRR